jgi:tetratricopeptide (TPR) repeat protein
MALVDEAMALASSGKLSPWTTGSIYCNMMSSCKMLADYQRADEWSKAAETWCEPHMNSVYPGICRVHRAGVLRLSGKWNEAEEQARLAHEQLGEFAIDVAAEAVYEIGEIRLRRGDHDGAEASFKQANEMGRDPVPGLAMLRLAQGKVDAARTLLRRALEESTVQVDRARLLPAWIEVVLEAGDREAAMSAVTELAGLADEFDSTVYAATATHGRGVCLLQDGKPKDAINELRQAWRLWKELDLPLEAARTRLELGLAYRALGNQEDASLELDAALATFRRLGAEPDIRRVEELVAG